MLQIVAFALIPLFLMIIAGAVSYRFEILPENSATVLNAFVYYFTLPALLFCSLATTPFEEIAQMQFIGGYLSAMIGIYVLMFVTSKILFKGHYTEAGMRATTGCFPNSAYLGLPIMMFLFEGSHEALLATTLAIILPIVIIIIAVATFELHRADKSQSSGKVVCKIVFSMIKTPLITASFAGVVYSFMKLTLPDFLVEGLHSFGMASVPCALFAIGILIAKQKVELKFFEIGVVNLFKLVLHPLLTAGLLMLFGVRGQLLFMGVVLAGMPAAALACVLAESYKVCEAETSASVLASMILYIPAMLLTLVIADKFGFKIIAG
ncbi:AEC family transporter [Maridesulfovibrio zosterae]|uniref:AEC family transporter n=1 Tax=Maridesulfovibrio zosterae TaxID=82171 RepID=UPI000487EA6A|nr:AEC family transporter [Maridesulfovibrio zosterae]